MLATQRSTFIHWQLLLKDMLLIRQSAHAAPVFVMRCSASATVSHVTDVPAELTSGSARHTSPPAHGDATIAPPTHCASWSPAHCTAVVLHTSPALIAANWAFSAIAFLPLSARQRECVKGREGTGGRTEREGLRAARRRWCGVRLLGC
jgi:hypothetical protein